VATLAPAILVPRAGVGLASSAIQDEGTRLMSHAGPPAEPPQDPDQSGSGADPAGEQKPYSPYPDNWESSNTLPSPPPPQNPYDQTNPYGQAQPGAYGQPGQQPYGQQAPYGQPAPYGGAPGGPANPYAGSANPNKPTFGFGGYAGWFTRVGAYLIDGICGSLASLPLWVGYIHMFTTATTTTDPDGTKSVDFHAGGGTLALIWVGILTGTAFNLWNVYFRQGRTGATIGKSVLAIRLVNSDLQPIGAGWAFVRQLCHIVDSLACGLGWLWPIWDSRKQTLADKIMNTFVIQATTSEPRPY
jgi:uncharacterized RDD family membrane protein YckC